jgi:hypothetical protein
MTDNTDDTTPDTPEAVEPEPMRILRIATCPSLSGRSQLTYHVGCNESGAIHFRLWGNTAAGMFSNTWFSTAEVSKLLSAPDGITSAWLQPLWDLTSRNNPGFTLALLQGEGLIEKSVLNPRTYRTVNPASFLERINALIASDIDLREDDEPSVNLPMSVTSVPKRGKSKKLAA